MFLWGKITIKMKRRQSCAQINTFCTKKINTKFIFTFNMSVVNRILFCFENNVSLRERNFIVTIFEYNKMLSHGGMGEGHACSMSLLTAMGKKLLLNLFL